MENQRFAEFSKERNDCMESIIESINFLKQIYCKKDRADGQNGSIFKLERKRLLRILNKYRGLYKTYRSTLLLLPDRGSEEVSVCEAMIGAALDVIDAAPIHLRKFKWVPILENLDVQSVQYIQPSVTKIVNEISEVVLTAVKRTVLKVSSYVVTEKTTPRYAVAPIVVKKPSIHVPVESKVITSVIEPDYLALKNVEKPILTEYKEENCTCHILDFYEDELSYIPTDCLKNSLVVTSIDFPSKFLDFLFCKFYCKIYMRYFWTYFLFSDFNFYFSYD